jgi:hypothetical protein
MDAVYVKLGGRGVFREALCKGAAAFEARHVSQDQCPAYGDLQPGESAEELVSDVPKSDRNRLQPYGVAQSLLVC